MTWVLIPVAIAINLTIGQIVLVLETARLSGQHRHGAGRRDLRTVGGRVDRRAVEHHRWHHPSTRAGSPGFPVAAAIGATAGVMANIGYFKTWWKVVVTGFVIAIVATVVGTPISIVIFGGISASGSSLITVFLLETGRSLLASVLTTNFLSEPLDKIATSLLAFAIIDGLSARYLSRFPRGDNAAVEKGQKQTELIIALVVVILLILFGIYILPSITGG
jgi:energy-coupling factor transport system substrate-specific component